MQPSTSSLQPKHAPAVTVHPPSVLGPVRHPSGDYPYVTKIADAANVDVWFMPDVDRASVPTAAWHADFAPTIIVKPERIGPFQSILARFSSRICVVGVHEVRNSESCAMFQGAISAWRNERPQMDVNVRWALHGAPIDSLLGICKQGFVCVPNHLVSNARVYGQGIYFTPCVEFGPSATVDLPGFCCQRERPLLVPVRMELSVACADCKYCEYSAVAQ